MLLVEEVLSPLIIGAPHQAHNVATGVQIKSPRLTHQLHAGLSRMLVALTAIAGMAAGNQVLPGGSAAA